MFGYVRPYKQELLVREFYTYKSVYCGLCKQLKKDYGIISTLLLNYDCTFFALFGIALNEEKPEIVKGRCCCNPLKRCNFCKISDDILQKAAALCIIASYYKLKDDIADSRLLKRILARMLIPLLMFKRKKAAKKYPDIEDMISKMLSEQLSVEKDENCIIDKAAEPTAKMYAKTMEILSKSEAESRIYRNFGYFFGKWVYLIDAIDDYEKDKKHGSFNPFITSKVLENKDEEEAKQYFNEVLNQCIAQYNAAYALINTTRFDGIIDNILGYGTAMMQKKIIFDKKVDVNV